MVVFAIIKPYLPLIIEDYNELNGTIFPFDLACALLYTINQMRNCKGGLGQFHLRVETNELLILNCFDFATELRTQTHRVPHQKIQDNITILNSQRLTMITLSLQFISERRMEDSLHNLLALFVILLISLLGVRRLLWFLFLWFCEGSHVNIYKQIKWSKLICVLERSSLVGFVQSLRAILHGMSDRSASEARPSFFVESLLIGGAISGDMSLLSTVEAIGKRILHLLAFFMGVVL